MTPLRQRFMQDLAIRAKAVDTIRVYTFHVKKFAQFFRRSPEELGPEEIRQFQIHLVQHKKVSWTYFNQAVCALRFLYGTTLQRPWPVTMIPFGRRPKTLPVVLGPEDVAELLAATDIPMHRMVLTVQYAAGLRLSEALHLQAADIDSQRMQLRVTHGKGAKQRMVPLSPRLLATLRDYWQAERPKGPWLFPSPRDLTRPLHTQRVQNSCQRALQKTSIRVHATPHTLRHSYATGLLEAGVDLLTIQLLLGHRSFTTTLIYLHVRRPHLESMPSPLDWLPVNQCPRFAEPSPAPKSTPSSARCDDTQPPPPTDMPSSGANAK